MIDKNGVIYNCVEQYFHAKKALLFDDKMMYDKIMSVVTPKVQKKYGRMVKGFDENKWIKNREQIMYDGCFLKFSQNKKLKEYLLSTGDKIIVEASPYDKVWGIGLGKNHVDVANVKKWRGKNLLGKCLMEVRKNIR